MANRASPPVVLADEHAAVRPDSLYDANIHKSSNGSEPHESSTQPQQTPNRRPTHLIPRISTSQSPKDPLAKSPSRTLPANPSNNVGLDPLSTQIFLRTNSNTEPTIAQRLRGPTRPDSPNSDSLQRQSLDNNKPVNGPLELKDRRKGSLLSRLSMRGSWRKDDAGLDSDSEVGESRTDGSAARALTTVAEAGGGYIPFFKEPPRYIRVKPHNTKKRQFDRVFLAQELLGASPTDEAQKRAPATAVGTKLLKAGAAIWAAEFSLDGRYLAVAGKDQVVRVFSVISTPEERRAHEEEEERNGGEGERLSAPVFCRKPTREFKGHTGDVLALSWSKNNFLLSSSMDKTVRLWHMSRAECLCTFKHSDLVTSIAFHPTDDRFFLAGSLDAQLRLWSIPDKSVAFSAATSEFITAVAFSPDGKTAICGLLSGLCLFYETEGLKIQHQVHVRSSRGKNAKGSKITGIRTAKVPADDENADVKVLISSNDSRVRIYSMKTKMLEVKFKGLENQSSQIHARFSDDSLHIISGSEDRKAYIYDLAHPDADIKDKQPYECFDAHPEVVTVALMAPTKCRLLLSASGDPIYDLCNPPAVQLLSLDERTASQTGLSEAGSSDPSSQIKKMDEKPAYFERCKHPDGNIIITADRTGTIKVFRQDCAFTKRQQSLWETGSKFSGRLNSIGRSGSIATRTSAGSRVHSRRASLNLGPTPMPPQPPSDRIMSWRQDIEEGRANTGATPLRSERSLSPMKASRTNLASEARKQPYAPMSQRMPQSPTLRTTAKLTKEDKDGPLSPTLPPTPSFSLISASDSEQHDDKSESGFWSFNRWRGNLPTLRYSTVSSPSESSPPLHPPPENNGNLAPVKRVTGRRSLGFDDLLRQGILDDGNRRKSIGTLLPRNTADSKENSIDEGVEEEEDPPKAIKKRIDSGVGRMSVESGPGGDSACAKCGSLSFQLKTTKRGDEWACERCGSSMKR
ncbi:hypothetical protein S40288_04003 [Stachybotrys chartarum IBT 40288]|nr:hypothetical protein S40288_04003 [Stachybotrys chartarum IBT 40288]